MSEQDFFKAVMKERDQSDSEAFLCLLKQAGVINAQNTANFIREHGVDIAAGLVGAAALAGGQYLATKPGKNGKSEDEAQANWAMRTAKNSIDEDLKAGREPGFTKEMAHAIAKGGHEVSKVMTKHPGKAALVAAPTGASLGLAAASLLKSQIFK